VSVFEYFTDFPRVWNGLVGISYLNIYDCFVLFVGFRFVIKSPHAKR